MLAVLSRRGPVNFWPVVAARIVCLNRECGVESCGRS